MERIPPTKPKYNVHRVPNNLNCPVSYFSKSARAWIRAVPDNPVRHPTLHYEVEFENEESSIFSGGRWPLPLVGDHKVDGDMIIIVKIITDWLMQGTLTRQLEGCQPIYVRTNKGLPSGITGTHLETRLTGSNECSKHTENFFNKCRDSPASRGREGKKNRYVRRIFH